VPDYASPYSGEMTQDSPAAKQNTQVKAKVKAKRSTKKSANIRRK
jgi:hypothetical protein